MSKVVQVVVLETDVVFLPVSWGYPILAGNGREARDRLEELRPVLVVSDIMMPIMDGWTLCRLLRAEAQYQALPIVLMSAAMPPDSNTDYTAFIRKPFQIHDLVSTLTAILGPPDASESSERAAMPRVPRYAWCDGLHVSIVRLVEEKQALQ